MLLKALADASMMSIDQLKERISNVRYAPLSDNQTHTEILFDLDGHTLLGVLRGRNTDLMIGFGDETDKAIAVRVFLDGDANPQ